jgi:membrane glycosyltransferase
VKNPPIGGGSPGWAVATAYDAGLSYAEMPDALYDKLAERPGFIQYRRLF